MLRSSGEVPELIAQEGEAAVAALWESISRCLVEWLRTLPFGFQELDCLFVHGSPVSASEALTADTPPLVLCDRLLRTGVNQLFCGRAGQAFEVWLQPEALSTQVQMLDHQEQKTYAHSRQQVWQCGTVSGLCYLYLVSSGFKYG